MRKLAVAFVVVGLVTATGSGVVGCSGGKKAARVSPPAADRLPPQEDSNRITEMSETVPALLLRDIRFDYDKAVLRAEAKTTLAEHARRLEESPSVRISIEGHCDERGTAEYNLALGDRRAQAAADYLVAYGIDENRISTISYGKERPLDPRHNEEAWGLNRRAAFVVTSGSPTP